MDDPFFVSLLRKRQEIQDELDSLERYITAYERRLRSKDGTRQALVAAYEQGKKPRGRPAEIADAVEDILRAAGRAMTRGELARSLIRKGLWLPPTDPAKYVGTILWRHRDRFLNQEGEGYSLRKRPRR